jgi:hypothetical protein
MESLEWKKSVQSVENHFTIVAAENQPEISNQKSTASKLITAPEHQLKRLKKHQDNLRDNPIGAVGALHEKAELLSNKTHYNPHDLDASIPVKPGRVRKPGLSLQHVSGHRSRRYQPHTRGFC